MNQAEILCSVRHLIIDMDGVLYVGNEVITGTSDLIDLLREQEIGFALATNSATRTPQQLVDKLAGMGVRVHPSEVLTSSLTAAGYLASIAPPGSRVFVVGMGGCRRHSRKPAFAWSNITPNSW